MRELHHISRENLGSPCAQLAFRITGKNRASNLAYKVVTLDIQLLPPMRAHCGKQYNMLRTIGRGIVGNNILKFSTIVPYPPNVS